MSAQLDRRELLDVWRHVDARVRSLGLARFDYGDFLSHPLFLGLRRVPGGRWLDRLLRIPDLIAPICWRGLLGVEPRTVPSTYYHLGMSYLVMEGVDVERGRRHVDEICELALGARLPARHLCWEHPYAAHGAAWKRPERGEPRPASCAHHVARLGSLLCRVGDAHGRPDLSNAGADAAQALLRYHNWHDHDDGTCTVSYYPTTDDEVINTAADVAALFAEVDPDLRDAEVTRRLAGIARTIVAEQDPSGAWPYCTRRHTERFGDGTFIDNHHTAMILAALAVIWDAGELPAALRESVRAALARGVEFYLGRLFWRDGTGRYFPDRRRETEIVGYAEGIWALFEIRSRGVPMPASAATLIEARLPQLIQRAIDRFYLPRSGDVACMRRFGRTYNIRSIRWGSGPFLQMIASYLALTAGAAEGR